MGAPGRPPASGIDSGWSPDMLGTMFDVPRAPTIDLGHILDPSMDIEPLSAGDTGGAVPGGILLLAALGHFMN